MNNEHHLTNVNPAPFSPEPDEVIIPQVRWYHHPWRVVAVIVATIIGIIILWNVLAASPGLRVCAIMLGLFWLFAFGIHPLHAAARTVGSWFDHDD